MSKFNKETKQVEWTTLQDAVKKRGEDKGKNLWINPQSFIDEMVKKYYNDAIRIAGTIRTPLLTDADKESFSLEALYEAAGLYNPDYEKIVRNDKGEIIQRWKPRASFTSFLMQRVRHVLLRETKLATMQKRCASVEIPLEEGSVTKYLRDVVESETAQTRQDSDDVTTAFDLFIESTHEAPFDFSEVLEKLKSARTSLSDRQFEILELILKGDINESEIARRLNLTRQMINLHMKVIRKRVKKVIKDIAPDFNFGGYKHG